MKKIWSFLSAVLFFNIAFCQDAELPAISSSKSNAFFIPAAICKKFDLTEAKGDAWMKVYNNNTDNAKLQRVNDIRWEATTKEAAIAWYKANIRMLSEQGQDITVQLTRPVGVSAWNVYEPNAAKKRVMQSLGVKQNQSTFTFVIDKYVAKIFVGVNEGTSVKESWEFAKEGLKALLSGSGNPKLAALVL